MKFTQEDFLKRAKENFGDKYDYSITKYNGSKKNIHYVCKTCKTTITQYANDHLKGKFGNCLCRRFDISEEDIKNTLGDKENYEIFLETREPSKVKIRCLKHNYIFTYYTNRKNKCPLCKKQRKLIENIEKKYNYNYDYSKADFTDILKKTTVICKEHGEFQITEEYLIKGGMCPECLNKIRKQKESENFYKKFYNIYNDKFTILTEYNGCSEYITFKCNNCGNIETSKPIQLINKSPKRCGRCEFTKKITKEIFLERAIEVHGDKYDYSIDKLKNAHDFVNIRCKNHNIWFKQRVYSHLNGHGCSLCVESSGERKIRVYLENKGITFKPYHKFDDLKDVNQLSYDFYIIDKNLLIEYNGEQHYKFCNDFHKDVHDFHKQLHHDWLKRKYAKENNINLLVIPYWDFANIEKILEEIIT